MGATEVKYSNAHRSEVHASKWKRGENQKGVQTGDYTKWSLRDDRLVGSESQNKTNCGYGQFRKAGAQGNTNRRR